MGTVVRIGSALALTAGLLVLGQAAALAEQGCTGATASAGAQLPGPFGAMIVAPTAQLVEPNLGQAIIKLEATNCPR